jgi:hypothetical protein
MINYSEHTVLPTRMQQALRDYVDQGVPQGGFLYHVMCNNLAGAVNCATDQELNSLKSIVIWVHNHAPEAAWGTEAKYLRWVQEHPAQARGPKELD